MSLRSKILTVSSLICYFYVVYLMREEVSLEMENTGSDYIFSLCLLVSPTLVMCILWALWMLFLHIWLSIGERLLKVFRYAGMVFLGLGLGVPNTIASLKVTELSFSYQTLYSELNFGMKVLDFVCIVSIGLIVVLPLVSRKIRNNIVIQVVMCTIMSCYGIFVVVLKTVPYNSWYFSISAACAVFAIGCMLLDSSKRNEGRE